MGESLMCARCIALFQNAAMPPYYRPPGDGKGESLFPGAYGVERATELLRGKGGYLETYDDQRIKTMDAATMIEGSALCLVHVFGALHGSRC
jgi:hypothetical protein